VPFARPVSVVECEVPPVELNVVIEAKAVPAVGDHAQVAFSFVVTLRVVCVVPAASVPEGAAMVIVGGVVSEDDVVTVTIALALAEPPVPVHVMLYVVFAVGETDAVPEVPLAVRLDPVQEVALVELQVRMDD
jgi:hypothetical protein